MKITARQADRTPASPAAVPPGARRAALVASLRSRFAQASASDDAAAKRALFKEAVYLGIQPGEFS
jgi:hypothetical protein